jgi:hypothetical protein
MRAILCSPKTVCLGKNKTNKQRPTTNSEVETSAHARPRAERGPGDMERRKLEEWSSGSVRVPGVISRTTSLSRRDGELWSFLEGCWLQMASCNPASTSSLCHWSRDLTGNPAIRTPAFLVSRRLVLEAASPAVCVCEREKKKKKRIVRSQMVLIANWHHFRKARKSLRLERGVYGPETVPSLDETEP